MAATFFYATKTEVERYEKKKKNIPAHVYYHLYKIKTLNGIGFDKRKHDLVLFIDRFFFVVVAFVKSFSMVVMLAY